MGGTDLLAHTVVPEIAIECLRKLKTGPFRIFYTAHMGPLSHVWASQAVINFWFPLSNLSLLWPIVTKLAVYVAYIKTQLGIATQRSVIKVNVTVTKNRNSVSCSITFD